MTKLDVKAASLYNHVDGIEEIKTAVGLKAIDMLNSSLAEAIDGEKRDKALKAASEAYRAFAKEHSGIYKTIMHAPMSGNDVLTEKWSNSFRPLLDIIESYKITETVIIDFFRYLRSSIHGFVSLEKIEFLRDPRITTEESFGNMITALIETLHIISVLFQNDRLLYHRAVSQYQQSHSSYPGSLR